jgi:Tfp pilus assembly protein FimT
MSIPFFSGFSTNTGLKTAEREIITMLRTARSYAVSQNTNFNAVFDGTVSPNTYRIANSSGTSVDKVYSLPNGVSYNTSVLTTVTFTPNGGLTGPSASNAVTVRITKAASDNVTVSQEP